MTDHASTPADGTYATTGRRAGLTPFFTFENGSGCLRFGCYVSVGSDVVFFCFVDETPRDEEPTYALYRVEPDTSMCFEARDTGETDEDGYAVFSVNNWTGNDDKLHVGLSDDRRMRLVPHEPILGAAVLLIDDLDPEGFSIDFVRMEIVPAGGDKQLSRRDVHELDRLLQLFTPTYGNDVVYNDLKELVDRLAAAEDVADGAVTVPRWVLGWVQHQLGLCEESRDGRHLGQHLVDDGTYTRYVLVFNRISLLLRTYIDQAV